MATERYILNVIVRPTRHNRHGFVVIEDHETGDNACVFHGPDALIQAEAELSRLIRRATIEVRIGCVWVVDSLTNEWRAFTGPDRLADAVKLAEQINGGE